MINKLLMCITFTYPVCLTETLNQIHSNEEQMGMDPAMNFFILFFFNQ